MFGLKLAAAAVPASGASAPGAAASGVGAASGAAPGAAGAAGAASLPGACGGGNWGVGQNGEAGGAPWGVGGGGVGRWRAGHGPRSGQVGGPGRAAGQRQAQTQTEQRSS